MNSPVPARSQSRSAPAASASEFRSRAADDQPSMILEPWHSPYYRELLEGLGLAKQIDLLMWELQFGELKGAVKWVPEYVDVSDTTASFYGGGLDLKYRMAPFGTPDVTATYTFDAAYHDVDLTAFTN